MKLTPGKILACFILVLVGPAAGWAADDTVATAVYAKVSVRTPGNAFDDSVVAMLKSASLYFGQNSGKLVRGEETKGTVELGELKYLGEAKDRNKTPTKENE